VADNIFGPWTVKGNPCVGAGAETTFDSQSTYVLPVPGKEAFIYMGDRWLKDNLADSRYVWLPFRMREDGSLTLQWRDEWNLADFLRVPQ
jgi:hypothetical protein